MDFYHRSFRLFLKTLFLLNHRERAINQEQEYCQISTICVQEHCIADKIKIRYKSQ